MRVLFWGTPDFAVPALAALLGEGLDVIAVVTQPDKPQGRSRSSVVASPVKSLALREEIPVLQPVKARDPRFVEEIRELEPDISVVVAYGQILSKEVIDLPKQGTLNIHASLLPALRGAAPIQGAILAGFAETGISIMQMVPELDAGPVLHQVKTPIGPDETYGELAMRLSELGALAIIESLALLSAGAITPKEQDPALVTHAPKVTRSAARIDWAKDAVDVARVIRAYDPRPAAYTTAGDAELKLFHARADGLSGNPGQVLEAGDELAVACGRGAVKISEVQPAGRRRMAAGDFTRGRAVAVGDVPVVHAITNDDKLLDPEFARHAAAVITALGARGAIHVRARWIPDRRLLEITDALLEAARGSGCTVVVNDRTDIALAAGASAVQLTSRSAGVADVREIAPRLRIGSSVHAPAEARDAGLFGADWCVAGHVFSSGSHEGEPGRGTGFVRACADASDVPVIAIGGVTPGRVRELVEAGAHGVASISGIWDARNPGDAAGRYLSEYVAAERRG